MVLTARDRDIDPIKERNSAKERTAKTPETTASAGRRISHETIQTVPGLATN